MSAPDVLLGASPAIETLRASIRRLLRGAAGTGRLPAVLLSGETGAGKGLVASLLHRQGPRAARPFVAVNCAAIPDTLMESELFGFERGAFTGAQHAKPGLFQAAHTGTIFLDEVGLLSEPLQAKLLKVVEDHAVRRLGGTRMEPVDVWIISATNADLGTAIRERRFREDLYYRLSVVPLSLPPLRERGDDILLLAEHFLATICADYGLPHVTLSDDAREALMAYSWPGNIRELSNAMERAALLSESPLLTAGMLDLKGSAAPRIAQTASAPSAGAAAPSFDNVMRDHLLSVLEESGGNISRAAALLGVARNTLRSRIRKLGLASGAGVARAGAGRKRVAASRAQEIDVSTAVAASAPPLAPAPRPLGGEMVRWEQRRVTMLRATMVGGHGADEIAAASNMLLAAVVEKIRSFGGRVEEVSSTAIEGSFGVEPLDDAARCAALTALAIRMSMARALGPGVPPVGLHVLIHTSAVRIGHAGGTARIERESKTLMGSALDLLSAAETEGPIVVTAATAAFLGRQFVLEPVGRARPKGAEHYRLVGHRTSEGFGSGLGPFVGRRAELSLLHSRVHAVLDGHGQVVALMGPPGVGKSRLLREFVRSAARPFRLLEAGPTSANIGAHRPMVELLKRLFQVQGEDDASRIRERVLAMLGAGEVGGPSLLAAFLSLLDVPTGDPTWDALEPAVRRERTLEAFKRLVLSESRVQPVLLLFEDLHWIDTESQALLDVVVQGLPTTARVLVLVSYRPEYRHGWENLSAYTQLGVDPLPASEATLLLSHLLGNDPGLRTLKNRLVEWTEGNPFFLEESVRSLDETGTLEGSPGAYKLGRPVGAIEVPATVEDVLAARFDRLAAADRMVLQAAATIGRNVPVALLAAVTGSAERELRGSLERLQAADVISEVSGSSEPALTFKHVLTHEVGYRTLLPEVRRRLHARALEVLEGTILEPTGEQLGRLAHHAFHGEQWSKAVEHLRRAGRRALFASANGEAVEIFDQALRALRHLPETPTTLQQALALRLTLRDALWSLGQTGRIREQLVEAEALAQRIGDQRGLGRVACYLSHYFWVVGELDAAMEASQRALTIASAIGDGLLAAETELYQGVVYTAQGDNEGAWQMLERAQSKLDPSAVGRPGAANRSTVLWLLVRCFLTRVLAELGRFEEGIAAGEEALVVAERNSSAFSLATALAGLGSLYLRKAEPETAIPLLERGLEVSQTYSVNNWLPTIGASLGSAYALVGRVDESLGLLEEAVRLNCAMGLVATVSLWRMYLGEAKLRAGKVAESVAMARQILADCRARGEHGYEAWALHLLGVASASTGDAGEARTRCFEALKLAERLGMRPLVVRCLLVLARLHERDIAAATDYRTRAGRLAAEQGMSLTLLESV